MGKNGRVVFISRPGRNGVPCAENFRYEECPEEPALKDGDIAVRTLELSVDPALRCRMNEDTGVTYMGPWELNETVTGLGGVGVVTQTKDEAHFQVGDIVVGSMFWPWKLNWIAKAEQITKASQLPPGMNPQVIISCLGLIGLTVLIGLNEKAHIKKGQCFVVSGAAGACGTLAGQIARIQGCSRVVGICGSDEKCQMLKDELGFYGAVNYKTSNDVRSDLKKLCPNGVDSYFDNVGGRISEAMNEDSHVILCGQIADYNKDVPYPPPISTEMEETISKKRITRERYTVVNYPEQFEEGIKQLAGWLGSGQLKVKQTVVNGLENAGQAFVDMMAGKNIGKMMVHVSDL